MFNLSLGFAAWHRQECLTYYYFCSSFQANHGSLLQACITQSVVHFPLRAYRFRLYHLPRLSALPCTIILAFLMLARCAAFVYLNVIGINYLFHHATPPSLPLSMRNTFPIRNQPMGIPSFVSRRRTHSQPYPLPVLAASDC